MIFPVRSDLRAVSVSVSASRAWPNRYDVIVFAVLAAIAVAVLHGARGMGASLGQLVVAPVTLDAANLPNYALRTTMRMFAAIAASLVFTFIVGALAAKSRKAELVIIPALDILQSVPVLGFLTFTVVFFMGLFPGGQLGAARPRRGVPPLPTVALAPVLATRGTLRNTRIGLEYDDVHVRRLVLRCCL